MELFSQFNAEMTANSPLWVGIWVNVMVAVLALAIPFSVARSEARWIWLGTVLGMAGTIVAYSQRRTQSGCHRRGAAEGVSVEFSNG